MIEKLSQIIVYMDDLETAKEFWLTKVGFYLVEDVVLNGLRRIEIAPTAQAETTLVLIDKHVVAQTSPELNLDTPSLLFQTTDIHTLYKRFQTTHITIGELIESPFGITFNFCDEEQNYFAVHQKNKRFEQ